jgi:hypothetical protein
MDAIGTGDVLNAWRERGSRQRRMTVGLVYGHLHREASGSAQGFDFPSVCRIGSNPADG